MAPRILPIRENRFIIREMWQVTQGPELWLPADFKYPPTEPVAGYLFMKDRRTNEIVKGKLIPIPLSFMAPLQRPPRSRTVWRYLDFWKFAAMVDRGLVYFCRADLLPDRLEGAYAEANQQRFTPPFDEFCQVFKIKSSPKEMAKYYNFMRERVYLNCWHINDGESGLMWKSYTRSNASVVIRSTVGALMDSLNSPEIGIYRVLYKGEKVPRAEWFSIAPFLFKRPNYSVENELRLLIQLSLDDEERFYGEKGLNVRIEPRSIIEEIILHPCATRAFSEAVQKYAASKIGAVRVTRSRLPH